MRGDSPNTTLYAWQERHWVLNNAIAGVLFAGFMVFGDVAFRDEDASWSSFAGLAVSMSAILCISHLVSAWWRRRHPKRTATSSAEGVPGP